MKMFIDILIGLIPRSLLRNVCCANEQLMFKTHNASVLLYHIVCPAKYRRAVFSPEVERNLKEICREIQETYEIDFLEIGADENHVHFLVQSVPTYSPKKLVQTIKSITARELFRRLPELKKSLWGGALWTEGYFISTVGQHGTEAVISKYVREQSGIKETTQLTLF